MKGTRIVKEYLFIAAGTLVLALGLNLFLAPLKLSSGGIGSLGTMLLHLFGIPLSVTNLLCNILLFLAGYRYLGKASVVKTLAGILFLSLFLQLTDGLPAYTEDIWIASVAGGLLVGVGVGLVVRCEASTGGSDFAAMVFNRFLPHISVATFILIIDCAIIVFAGIVFHSITITLYSVISLYITTKVTDGILSMGISAKSVYIISSSAKEIATAVHRQFERGITGIYSKGMYSGLDTLMLLCVVTPKEVPKLTHLVRSMDKSAFLIVTDTHEVLGEGF